MIAILSYGLGNIKAISNIYHRLNIPCIIASNSSEVEHSTKLILPGVGAFDRAMEMFERSGMRDTVDHLVLEKRIPVLGICVGMQMMTASSEEGNAAGLGWIRGRVVRLDTEGLKPKPLLPHMGWNSIERQKDHLLLRGIDREVGFYFLHSYRVECDDPTAILATSQYGADFPSAINMDHIVGVQFHPEKSHRNGVQVFRNFASL